MILYDVLQVRGIPFQFIQEEKCFQWDIQLQGYKCST